jgi:crotonobetainyl-CoA:carnitine CoA-transferase CaiB-like acyl-CoA transferase
MASLLTSHLSAGWMPKPAGNEAWSQSPSSGAFETADGLLMIAANNDKQFGALCAGIGRADILEDPRWKSPDERATHAKELRAELVAIFKSRPAMEWERMLDKAGVPAAKVRSLDEVLAEEHAKTRHFTSQLDVPHQTHEIHVPTLGFKVNDEVVAPSVAPPALGGDTEEVLRGLGYGDADLRRLNDQGVI